MLNFSMIPKERLPSFCCTFDVWDYLNHVASSFSHFVGLFIMI